MAFAVWFTGLPGSGKTAVASRAAAILRKKGIDVKILQLDEIRRVLTPIPKYTDEERDIVYASLAYLAKLLAECGVNVFIDATANRRKYRDTARKMIPQFAEVYIRCSLEVCMEREARRKAAFSPKGIYRKSAQTGAAVPGVIERLIETYLDLRDSDGERFVDVVHRAGVEPFRKRVYANLDQKPADRRRTLAAA